MIICKTTREIPNWGVYSVFHKMNCSSCPHTCRASRAGGGRCLPGHNKHDTHHGCSSSRGAQGSPQSHGSLSFHTVPTSQSSFSCGMRLCSPVYYSPEVSLSYSSWEASAAMPSCIPPVNGGNREGRKKV